MGDMKTLHLNKKDLDLREYKQRHAMASDFSILINEPTLVYVDGRLVIAYLLPADSRGIIERVKQAVEGVRIQKDYRTSGLKTASRVFGFEPRKALRKKDYCSPVSLAHEDASRHQAVLQGGEVVASEYSKVNPDLYAEHARQTEENIVDEYKVDGMPFTSGIINRNNPLKYHFDSGNYREVWSGMYTFKNKVKEGHLSFPEYDLGVNLQDKSLILFDGQKILHGVTPITQLEEGSTRHTVVYYSLRQMWNCLPLDEELLRARKLRDERELKRRNGILPTGK